MHRPATKWRPWSYAIIDLYRGSGAHTPREVMLDIYGTVDVVRENVENVVTHSEA